LAALTADVLRRLLSRVTEPLLPDLVLTGGNAIGPVVAAAVAATDGRVRSARRLDPTAAAQGALRIAIGEATALEGYPHELGIAVRRIRHGLLESTTVAISEPGTAAMVLTVDADQTGPLPVRVRMNRQGPWRETEAAQQVRVRHGTYRVSSLGRRAGLGAVLLRPVDGGEDVVYPLGPDAGRPVATETDQPRSTT
jgi:hypothetical protein